MLPYGRQEITQKDVDLVVKVLKSDFLTQGPYVPKFENSVAEYCNALHAVATNSATSALHVACLALNLREGDWLWTTPITFVASANCGLYCGAKVDFVDIDPITYNMCPKALEKKLIHAKKTGSLPKVVIPVHLCGQSCDMRAISALAKVYGFKIIEDASHAIGGRYLDKPIGGCKYSDITVFSFHPVKIITTGEGGMALTNDSKIAQRMSLLRGHGITRDTELMTHEPDGDWYYQQINLGFNYRMTDMQAALGIGQLERLDKYVSDRHKLAARYSKSLEGLPLIAPFHGDDAYSAFHLYVIRVEQANRKKVFDYLRKSGIGVNLHYIPVHTQPYYQQISVRYTDLSQAELYYKEAITLPLYPTMTHQQQDAVVSSLHAAFQI